MSSNIRITKTCEYCNKEYTAQTIRTRYCSHQCNRNAYRLDKRRKKIEGAKKSIQVTPKGKFHNANDYLAIQNKELLTINESCALLNITHVTLRRWLKDGIVESSRLGKKHLIKRSHLNQLIG